MTTSGFTSTQVELRTERLRLRRLREEDSQTVRELWLERDPRVPRRINPSGRPSVEDVREPSAAQLIESESSRLSLLAIENIPVLDLLGTAG
ncbi:hypothetical protein ACX80W_11420 [Arthrobacter sp. TMN-37]